MRQGVLDQPWQVMTPRTRIEIRQAMERELCEIFVSWLIDGWIEGRSDSIAIDRIPASQRERRRPGCVGAERLDRTCHQFNTTHALGTHRNRYNQYHEDDARDPVIAIAIGSTLNPSFFINGHFYFALTQSYPRLDMATRAA